MRIFIAEDDLSIANSLKKSFNAEGHEVIIAGDGKKTLDCIKEVKFDALLLDWRMPQLSGIKFVKDYARPVMTSL